MATTIGSKWRVVRTVDVSGGFTPDANWVSNNDLANATASGINNISAKVREIDLVIDLADSDGNTMPVLAGTSMQVEFILLQSQSDAGDRLISEFTTTVTGPDVQPYSLPLTPGIRFIRIPSFTTSQSPATLRVLASAI